VWPLPFLKLCLQSRSSLHSSAHHHHSEVWFRSTSMNRFRCALFDTKTTERSPIDQPFPHLLHAVRFPPVATSALGWLTYFRESWREIQW
jgi:hypothetical protein